mgnify:CR=1 FL=1
MRRKPALFVRSLAVLAAFSASVPLGAQGASTHLTAGLSAPVDPAPGGYWFGGGCGGNGQSATVSVFPGMRPGFVSRMQIEHLPPNTAALLLLGSSPTDWWGMPLPLPLGGLGLTGCQLLVAPEITFGFGSGSGTALANFVVPPEPLLAASQLYMQVFFDQAAANPAGVAVSRGYATRIAPLPTATAPTSTITRHGITFQFAQPVPAGRFVNGDWFVVGPATLVGMSPPCAVVNGRVVNGAMINPDPSTQDHGYDSLLFDPQRYSHARNVAWNLSAANPRQLVPNQSLIKVVSNPNTSQIPVLQTCAVLTVLDSAPPEGSFRPPYAGADHAVRYDVEMLDLDRLLSLPPPAGRPDFASQTARFERPWLDHAPGWATRYMHPLENMPDYGRDFAALYNEAALMCHTAAPLAAKRELAMRLVQIGIDFFGNVEGGAYWEGVGGHGSGRKLPILFAGALLGDADMLAVGVDYPSVRHPNGTYSAHFGEDCQTFYVEQTGPGQVNWGHGGYTASHIGLPEYGFSHVHYPSNDQVLWMGDSYRRCCTANAWIGAVLCARMMGLVDAWRHPALFDYTDRYAQIETGWTLSWSTWVGAMWQTYRPVF